MDAVLHRLEALPGDGRYAITFRRPDGAEQTAVAQIDGAGATPGDDVAGVVVAEASLPSGWTRASEQFAATAAVVLALHAARGLTADERTLRDVPGGWDVGLGNIVLGADGVPQCTAHGALEDRGDAWECPECGARALLG